MFNLFNIKEVHTQPPVKNHHHNNHQSLWHIPHDKSCCDNSLFKRFFFFIVSNHFMINIPVIDHCWQRWFRFWLHGVKLKNGLLTSFSPLGWEHIQLLEVILRTEDKIRKSVPECLIYHNIKWQPFLLINTKFHLKNNTLCTPQTPGYLRTIQVDFATWRYNKIVFKKHLHLIARTHQEHECQIHYSSLYMELSPWY